MLRFFSIFILFPAIFGQSSSPNPGSCCQKRTVSDVSADLNGVYMFKRDGGDSQDQDCSGGCVYTKEGADAENEYCFRAVTTGAATIEEQCEAVSSTTVSSTAGSTLNPTDTINAANEAITKANEDHAKATEDANTASEASNAVDTIQAALGPSSTTVGRIKRQASTTVSPVSGCEDFSSKYSSLLEELTQLSDNNIDLIKQLVTVLTAAIPVPCTETEKETLKDSTDSKVSAAKAKATEFKEEKEKKIEEYVQIVKDANQQIDEANNQLISMGSPTIPAATASFTVPTDPATSQQTGPQSSPESSTQSSPPESSTQSSPPESSTGPQSTTEGGSSQPPESSPSSTAGGSSSAGPSSTPPNVSTIVGRKRSNNFRIIKK